MDKRLERILPRVQKPARYVGGEFNAIMKDKSKVDTRVAFCFPDTYEIGMSNLGMRILYGVMNNIDGVWCERCFAPWGDMEQEMRRANIPLYALESFDPIRDFDIIAFSVGYEMAFPAMVDMLDLAGVPLHASERTALTPLVVAGGTAMYNCEPIADFIDLAFIGEGEEMDVELIELHRQARREGWSKHDFLVRAAQIRSVYVPSLYDVDYNDDGTVKSITPKDGAPPRRHTEKYSAAPSSASEMIAPASTAVLSPAIGPNNEETARQSACAPSSGGTGSRLNAQSRRCAPARTKPFSHETCSAKSAVRKPQTRFMPQPASVTISSRP